MISETKPLEIELKLIIPVDKVEKLKRFPLFVTADSDSTYKSLYNAYYDTPNGDLAKNKVALRIRQKEGVYIQTLKTAGNTQSGLHQRGEWEWVLPSNQLDLALLKEAAWPDVLRLENMSEQLTPIFTTNFNRQSWLVEHNGVEVEVVLDQGKVAAGALTTPICEIELELLSDASVDAFEVLYHLAEKLAAWVPVRLSSITKAERGYKLVQQQRKSRHKVEAEPHVEDEWSEDATLSALSRSFDNSIRVVELAESSEDIHAVLSAWREFEGWVYIWLASHSSPLPLPVYQYLQSLHQWFMGVSLGKHKLDGSSASDQIKVSKSSQEMNTKQVGFSQIAISRWFTQLHLMKQPVWPSTMTAKRQWCQDLLSDVLLVNQSYGSDDASIGTMLSLISRLCWAQKYDAWEALPESMNDNISLYVEEMSRLVDNRIFSVSDKQASESDRKWLDDLTSELRESLVKPYA